MPIIEDSFNSWKNKLNEIVYSHIKVNLDDLPDQNYRIWFDMDVLNPKELSFIIIGDFLKQSIEEYEYYLYNS